MEPQGFEGRTGPAGHSPHCLTLLSEPTKKLAVLAVFQPPTLRNGALAMAKQQGPEGRTGPAGHGPPCLTLLSEPTRKLHRHRPQIEKVGTDGSQRGNQRLPWQGTAGSQTLKLTVPNLGTNGLPLQRTSVS